MPNTIPSNAKKLYRRVEAEPLLTIKFCIPIASIAVANSNLIVAVDKFRMSKLHTKSPTMDPIVNAKNKDK